jgi:hypothetical protein
MLGPTLSIVQTPRLDDGEAGDRPITFDFGKGLHWEAVGKLGRAEKFRAFQSQVLRSASRIDDLWS